MLFLCFSLLLLNPPFTNNFECFAAIFQLSVQHLQAAAAACEEQEAPIVCLMTFLRGSNHFVTIVFKPWILGLFITFKRNK